MKKKNTVKKLVLSTALAVLVIGSADKALAAEWKPNSVETIKSNVESDRNKYKDKEYDIRWGDYLYGISKATDVKLKTLIEINKIANKDLIIAGDKIYYGSDSNIVTKDNKGNTNIYQEKRYDGSNQVKEVPKDKLSGKEEKAIVEKNPSLAKDFNSKDKINDRIIEDNKKDIKGLDEEIKDIKDNADKKIKEQEAVKKDLNDKKDKLVKEDKDKNKEEISKIDEQIKDADEKIDEIKKETDKKVEDKEKQKDYLETENEKLEAEKKGDKKTSDEKQKELDDKKDNDPYEVWKKEQLEKNPNLKEEDLTREQYEIAKKDKDTKPEEKPSKDEDKEEDKPSEKPSKEDDGKKEDEPVKPEEPKEDEGKGDKPEEKPEDSKKDDGKKEETKYVSKVITEKVPFKTIRKHNDPSLKTNVVKEGKDGLNVYNVQYKDGKEVSRVLDKEISYPAQDEVIESYVKVQDAKYETQLVEDKSKPIYEDKVIYMAFVSGFSALDPDEKEVYLEFESDNRWGAYKKAQEYFSKNLIVGNYGDLDPIVEHNLVGYEKVETQVKVADEVWGWE